MESLEPTILISVLALIVLAAALYSSVGHGGASGYLAVMALFGMAPAFMKPAALSMNVVVAGYVFFRLWRAGHFNGRLFAPFAIASIPFAWLGGAWTLRDTWYQWLVGAALLLAAIRLFTETRDTEARACVGVSSCIDNKTSGQCNLINGSFRKGKTCAQLGYR